MNKMIRIIKSPTNKIRLSITYANSRTPNPAYCSADGIAVPYSVLLVFVLLLFLSVLSEGMNVGIVFADSGENLSDGLST